MPGLVQNCPAPKVKEVWSADAMFSKFCRKAPGRRNTGLVLLISAKKGIGSGREEASFIRIFPACREPVNPPALIKGCFTNHDPTS